MSEQNVNRCKECGSEPDIQLNDGQFRVLCLRDYKKTDVPKMSGIPKWYFKINEAIEVWNAANPTPPTPAPEEVCPKGEATNELKHSPTCDKQWSQPMFCSCQSELNQPTPPQPQVCCEPPHRAFEISLKVGADSKDEMLELFAHFLDSIEKGSMSCVTGGSSVGGYYNIHIDESMTHERYAEELEKHLASTNSAKSAAQN